MFLIDYACRRKFDRRTAIYVDVLYVMYPEIAEQLRKLICICGKQFRTRGSFSRHVMSCRVALAFESQLDRIAAILRALTKVSSNGKHYYNWKCLICGKSFKEYQLLKNHILRDHRDVIEKALAQGFITIVLSNGHRVRMEV